MSARVLYASPFVPAEWIAAHGLRPYRVFASDRAEVRQGASAGLCPYAHAFDNESRSSVHAVIFATTCDQMRRASELHADGANRFLFNMPATWQTRAAEMLYRGELERLSRFLVKLGGTRPGDARLADVMRDYDLARARLALDREALSARRNAERLVTLYQAGPNAILSLSAEPQSARAAMRDSGTRLALVGGPLFREQFALFDEIESSGARVVLDASETGERTLPDAFVAEALARDPLNELTRAYFAAIPDVFRRPNTQLFAWLERLFFERRVQGVILLRCVWCDLWHAEVQRMKDRLKIPVVELDPSGTAGDQPRARGRLQALLEVFT